MPVINTSTYKAPLFLKNRHLNTIYAALFRKVGGMGYERERVETEDDDFIDLDWSVVGGDRLLIALHGLEGDSDRSYIKGMLQIFNQKGWDGLAVNFRGCSGEPNRQLHSYNMGVSGDLDFVVQHVLGKEKYREIALVGFSLGGNVTLKYLGEQGNHLPKEVRKAVAFSVPCHIESSNVEISRWYNWFYLKRFMDSLNAKAVEKAQRFSDKIQFDAGHLPKNFYQFDDLFTAPAHGFKDGKDYWTQSSSLQFLPEIRIPTLLVNAKDDSFLSARCYPFDMAKKHPQLYLETPQNGGHVGFVSFNGNGIYWSEKRALEFVEGG